MNPLPYLNSVPPVPALITASCHGCGHPLSAVSERAIDEANAVHFEYARWLRTVAVVAKVGHA